MAFFLWWLTLTLLITGVALMGSPKQQADTELEKTVAAGLRYAAWTTFGAGACSFVALVLLWIAESVWGLLVRLAS